jgi:hypothetical protein
MNTIFFDTSKLWSQQILSIAFELAEYSLQHQLANFAEVCKVWVDVFFFSLVHSAGGIM